MRSWRCFICLIAFFFLLSKALVAQVIQAGLKGGWNYSWVGIDDKTYKQLVNVKPIHGFNAGAALSFKVRDRYFLHTEYIYSTKGRIVTADPNSPAFQETYYFEPDVEDRVRYHYAEVPVMFLIQFKGKAGKGKEFKWYVGAGPNFSYWLGGRGRVTSGTIAVESELYKDEGWMEYKIKLGTRPLEDQATNELVFYNNVRRFQLGLNFGAGLVLEPTPKHRFLVDLRYEFGGSRIGKKDAQANYILPPLYFDPLMSRSQGIRASIIYLYEFKTDKQTRNRGKSTIKNNNKGKLKRR